jgi:secondary thiamine-phosphate synthase enzyme
MRQVLRRLTVDTPGRGFTDLTHDLRAFVVGEGVTTGLLTVFCRHTSASLLVQENASPDVRADLLAFFDRIAPETAGLWRHADEGPDDMPAHVKAALTQSSLAVPVEAGRPVLGTWQAVWLVEHRRSPHRRELVLHLTGE